MPFVCKIVKEKYILINMARIDLDLQTPVIVKAYHKITSKEIVKEMTIEQWYSLKKSKDYFYKCLQKS